MSNLAVTYQRLAVITDEITCILVCCLLRFCEMIYCFQTILTTTAHVC